MATKQEIIEFYWQCIEAKRCSPLANRTVMLWAFDLQGLPGAAFPLILDRLIKLKRKPKNFLWAVLRFYEDLVKTDEIDENSCQ